MELIIPAFVAGLLTFLAPCTLPLVPAYLGFISGVSLEDLADPELAARLRWKVFWNGFFFIFGFSIVFVLLGSLAGFAGEQIAQYRDILSRVGGVFVILFGLLMLDVLKIPFLSMERRFTPPSFFRRGTPVNSLTLGVTFGLGWTPCVGPVLGAVLTFAATEATALSGALLLAVFSFGLSLPFLVLALGIGSASRYIQKVSKYLKWVSFIGGAFLIFLGILMVTNKFGVWNSWFYQIFDFINYDLLLDYL